jgi:glycosyltransferase involved in cell wall biosynthesis
MSLRDRLRGVAALPWRTMDALGLAVPGQSPVSFVVERRDWSIRWDGIQICRRVNDISPGTANLTTRPERVVNGVAHFGSQFMWEVWHEHISPKTAVAISYFHGKLEDGPDMARHVDAFRGAMNKIDRVIVANTEVESRLRSWGVPDDHLVRIPIGVDTTLFTPPSPETRQAARRQFGVPEDRLAIGSFQKDGNGWGEGNDPKMVKGPDLFLKAVEKLARDFPVFVLLTGPARGYVKTGLDDMGVPYAHHFLDDYLQIVSAYHALDLYLMTSREEGGPKAILECAATGVPLVSSRVGMASDVIVDGSTGFLVDVGDTDTTVGKAAALLESAALRERVTSAAHNSIEAYDWHHVGEQHYYNIYKPLIERT